VIDMMTKQVRPVSGKPITTLALEAVEQRLASARADFIMARSHTRSTKEAEDTFAVSLDVITNENTGRRTEMPRRYGRVKAKPPFGRCAPRSLDPSYATRRPAAMRRRASLRRGLRLPLKGTEPMI
jgi:hypothetical protein